MGHWLIDTAGIGSLVVIGVGLSVLAAYARMLRWIQTAPPDRPAATPPAETAPAQAAHGGR